MQPAQVLDLHGDLIHRLQDSMFSEVVKNFFRLDLDTVDKKSPDAAQLLESNARYLRTCLTNHVNAAYDFRVTEDMTVLIQHVANSLNDEDLWDSGLAPTGCGLVRFDRPVEIVDIRGRVMKIHWITWGPAASESASGAKSSVTLFSMWNDSHDPDEVGDEYALSGVEGIEKMSRILGRWRWVGASYAQNGMPVGPPMLTLDEDAHEALRASDGVESVPFSNAYRVLHALWLLLNQSITNVADEFPDRAGRRRAERAKIPARVQVIHLRRIEGMNRADGESLIEWAHRWVVRGHPRWQVCGPNYPGAVNTGPDQYRARIWIAPFIKGPEGKPLVVTDKVYSLER